MKRKPPDSRNALSALRLSLALSLATLIPLLLYGSAPSWWSNRGVLIEQVVPDDYAPANQGQLKNIAKAAAAEMDAKLSGGAGETLHQLIASWSNPSSQTNDFAPLNLGQLKNVAKPFYDRLIMEGVVDFYPWLRPPNAADDFAIANIGQVKKLFAFEIPAGNLLDDPLADRIAAGQFSANLALEANAVWIWADHFATGSDFERNYPSRVSGLSSIRSVSAGERHLIALAGNGMVWSWGENGLGQLGDGTTANRLTPGLVPNLANILSVKAGGFHNLALQADGTVLAWGDNYYGQLGTGGTIPSSTPTLVTGLSAVRKIAASYQASVALTTDGLVWTWGYEHYFGQDIFNLSPRTIPDLSDVVDIAAGYEHVVAVKSEGSVWVWGSNYYNQLGNGTTSDQYQSSPAQVSNLSNIVKVASSWDHTLALAGDGTVWAWGYNVFGQLGDGTSQPRRMPVQVSGLTGVIAIATNWSYSLAMKADGTVWAWGDGATGTLPGADLHVPQQVGLGFLDTNRNGMDDRWEMQFLGNLDQSPDADFDGDGISNRQEYLRGTDPKDYYNGVAPIIEIAGGNNQIGNPGTFLTKPFKVRLRNQVGQLLVNAPVTFSISGGSGALAETLNGPLEQSLPTRTDPIGEATVYHALPDAAGTSTRTIASAGNSDASAFVTFRGVVKFSLPPTPTPPPDPNATPTPSPSPTPSPFPPYRYAIIDLGKDLFPIRINNKGWILLQGSDGNGNWSSYRWKGGMLERLDYSGPYTSLTAADINDDGAVVGSFSRNGPWGATTERETGGGLFWPPGRSTADKLSASGSYSGFGRNAGLSFKLASASAVNNANDTFGAMCTGTVQGFLFGTLFVMNSAEWPFGAGSAVQLSNASATNVDNTSFFAVWNGSIDTITRANAAGHYIGSKLTDLFGNPFGVSGTTTGMIDGQPVSFSPIDINESGIVVGSAGADMIVRSPPNSQTTINGVSPLAINDHTRAAPSASVQSGPAPTPIPAPQILAWSGDALVIWERQEDGHTWHPFGLEEMILSMDGWEYLEPYDMSDAGSIVGRGWYSDPSNPSAPGEYHAFLLVPLELIVDGNRDGEMSFDDPTIHDQDATTEQKPYRFWLNDDDDGASGDPGDHVPISAPDYADGVIRSVRDLEDFSRLHLNVQSFEKALGSGSIKAAFEWKHTSASPRIKLYRAISASTDYLTKESTAASTMLFPFRDTLGEIAPGLPLFIPQDFWVETSMIANVPKTLPVAWFLFEGSGEGKGELVLSFWKDGHKIGETPGAWLDLKNIKKLYQHQVLGGPDPWMGVSFEAPPEEQKQVIVFVHGWRLSPPDAVNFAETMFKRIWWRGFKGRFAAVRWDTYYNASDHGWVPYAGQAIDAYLGKYNDSEHNAWLTGQALKGFVDAGLPADYSKNVVAHSMGNVVTGAALQQGMTLDKYALLNAALPAACYDEDPNLKQAASTTTAAGVTIHLWDQETPDDDSDPPTRAMAYRSRLKNVGGNLISFYLPRDYATSYAWELNNALTKPPAAPLSGPFLYKRDFTSGQKLIKGIDDPGTGEVAVDHYITDPNEAEPYACRTWGKAVGAESRTHGKLNGSGVNLDASFNLDQEHSGEFNREIQTLVPFYRELLRQLNIPQNL
jgi:alpha-tubulin suppressor-like RCC1 family protein